MEDDEKLSNIYVSIDIFSNNRSGFFFDEKFSNQKVQIAIKFTSNF